MGALCCAPSRPPSPGTFFALQLWDPLPKLLSRNGAPELVSLLGTQDPGKGPSLPLLCCSPSFPASSFLLGAGWEVLGKWARNHFWGWCLGFSERKVTPEELSNCQAGATPYLPLSVCVSSQPPMVYVSQNPPGVLPLCAHAFGGGGGCLGAPPGLPASPSLFLSSLCFVPTGVCDTLFLSHYCFSALFLGVPYPEPLPTSTP